MPVKMTLKGADFGNSAFEAPLSIEFVRGYINFGDGGLYVDSLHYPSAFKKGFAISVAVSSSLLSGKSIVPKSTNYLIGLGYYNSSNVKNGDTLLNPVSVSSSAKVVDSSKGSYVLIEVKSSDYNTIDIELGKISDYIEIV